MKWTLDEGDSDIDLYVQSDGDFCPTHGAQSRNERYACRHDERGKLTQCIALRVTPSWRQPVLASSLSLVMWVDLYTIEADGRRMNDGDADDWSLPRVKKREEWTAVPAKNRSATKLARVCEALRMAYSVNCFSVAGLILF